MNRAEQVVAEKLKSEGWEIYNSGWPDFLLTKFENGKLLVRAVEVKSAKTDGAEDDVRPNQWIVLNALAAAGIPVSVIREDGAEYVVKPPSKDSNAR